MCNRFFILFLLSFLFTFTIFHFTSVLSANDDDGFLSVNPEDYYILESDGGEESKVSKQLNEENNTSDHNALPSTPAPPPPPTTTTIKKHPFNIAVTADWGCEEDTKKNSREYSEEKS